MNPITTLKELIEIQEKQLTHYEKELSKEKAKFLRDTIKNRTKVDGYDLDAPITIDEANYLVPRGFDIETIFYKIR